MCWATPGIILDVTDDAIAKVDFGGVTREVSTGFESVQPGDLVMVHSGVILGKITKSELVSNLRLFMEAERIGLQDLGYSAEEAGAKAREEFRTLLTSLGLNPETDSQQVAMQAIESDGSTAKPQFEVPGVAYRERFRTALSDMDYLQVMHYTNYSKFCERAWMGLLAALGYSYTTLIHRYGIFIPTVECAAKVYAPVRMDTEIEVAIWVEEIGRKHIKYRGTISNLTSSRLAADISHTAVCTDTTLMESVDLPKELAEKLSAHLFTK